MSRGQGVDVTVAAMFVFVAVISVRVGIRNLAEFRRALRQPPLDDAEVLAQPGPTLSMPRGWPAPAAVETYQSASAYRDLARQRADSNRLTSEMVVLVSGAALGVTLSRISSSPSDIWPSFVPFATGVFGLMLGRISVPRWLRIAARYERRRAELFMTPT